MNEHFKIVTNTILRDERIERRIQEMARERVIYIMILAGAGLVLFAVM